ncbi:alkaline phosphatase family protein [Aneurinibacillus uraniidurans]|uniref:alkaline phosphatase family protein n=1 Tax=Aneurinibacillus uraniidurans TaxID=2966586 RepID=UPI00234BEAD8|nr:alkaline phosphatase family protein [Aneurinibacillus sp. B1]WCN39274.1 alkaline phosphatase family protein [Aneurinibacillus sp. B1]
MSNKVIAIVVDGMRYDKACETLGFIQHLVETNQAALYKVKSELPSLSRPLYEVLLTGTPVFMNEITSNQTVRLSTEKSLFHLTKENGLRNATASYYWVSELYNRAPFDFIEDREQEDESKPIQYGKFYWDEDYPDSHLIMDAEVLRRKYDPDFLYIHPMGVDVKGENYGSESKEYREQILKMGSLLAQLLPIWMKAGYHILITSDHGMSEYGNHGGITDGERDVPLFIISPRVEAGIHEEVVPQLAFAPLVCELLGIERTDKMISYRLPGLKETVAH